VGDIYLGKVINILENINVAFIRLDKRKQNGFMMLKDDSYFNKNIRLGEDIVVQVIKEEISKKGPTVTQKIFFEDEKIKVYPYNKNDSIFERKFNFSQRQYLQIVTKLIKPKDSSIEFKEKDNKINIWEMVRRLKGLEKQSLIIERKIKNVLHSSCLISNKQEILEILLKKNLIQKDAVIITKSKAEGVKIRKNLNLLSVKKKKFT
jgi:ribonuclease G